MFFHALNIHATWPRVAVIAGVIVALTIALTGILAPVLTPDDPYTSNYSAISSPPSGIQMVPGLISSERISGAEIY